MTQHMHAPDAMPGLCTVQLPASRAIYQAIAQLFGERGHCTRWGLCMGCAEKGCIGITPCRHPGILQDSLVPPHDLNFCMYLYAAAGPMSVPPVSYAVDVSYTSNRLINIILCSIFRYTYHRRSHAQQTGNKRETNGHMLLYTHSSSRNVALSVLTFHQSTKHSCIVNMRRPCD